MTYNNNNDVSWQFYAFSEETEYRELQGKYAQLCRRFANMTRKDPNFDKTYTSICHVEEKIANKQKHDWLVGCEDSNISN